MIPSDEYFDATATLVASINLMEMIVDEEMMRSNSGLRRADKASKAFQDKLTRVVEFFEFDKQVTLERLKGLDSCREEKHALVSFIEKLTFPSTKSNSSISEIARFIMQAREIKFLLRHIENMAIINNASYPIHPKR